MAVAEDLVLFALASKQDALTVIECSPHKCKGWTTRKVKNLKNQRQRI